MIMKPRRHILFLTVLVQCAVATSALSQSHWETAIYAEDTWHYFVGTNPPPANWSEIDFDASSWSSGPGGFGYGDGDDNTTIPNTVAVFLRKSFQVGGQAEILSAAVHGDYDDGFVAYINGVEIARSFNMGIPGTTVPYDQTTEGDHEAVMYQGGLPDVYIMDNNDLEGLLLSGENVFAVEVHNVDSTSSDMSGLFFLSFELPEGVSYYGTPPDWFFVPTEFSTSHLPIVVVNTNGQDIPNDNKITAHMGIIDNGPGETNHLSDPYNHYDGFIGIELRGSSTLWFPKKQFAVETRDSLGENNNVSLFGMPEENDWIFNAPYTDKSLMRNVLIYNMARDAGRYASRTHYFELVLNDDYRGVYVMLEKVKRDDNRVDISKLEPDELSGDDVTGGYIIKIDKWDGENLGGWYSEPQLENYSGFYYQYHYPKPDEIAPEQQEYIINYIDDFEQVMNSENYMNTTSGYPSIIHWDSFVDFLIMQEITKNVDGYRLSSYLYKDIDSNDGRLVAGPIWDFNLGFGNADYCDGWATTGWAIDFNLVCPGDSYQIPFWWYLIWSDESFRWTVQQRWHDLRQTTLSDNYVNAAIDSLHDHIGEAANRNFERWPILGEYVWPNYFIGETYEEEVEYLRDWIMTRMEWMDNELLATRGNSHLAPEAFSLNPIYPNPFNRSASIQYLMPKDANIKLDIFNAKGVHIYRLFEGDKRAGIYTLSWDGKNNDGQEVSSGVYIILLQENNMQYNQRHYIETRKVILVK
jgi:hypothetical protein